MKVFVTGATGFVGSAVTRELIANGHTVLGLARSDRSAATVEAAGAEVHRGDLSDLDSLRRGARASDAVIHTGFVHDFSRFAESCEIDRQAIMAIGEAVAETKTPLVVTAGVAFLDTAARVATERDPAHPPSQRYPRASEAAAADLAARGLPVSVMRLPPSVHGAGDHGFVPMLIAIAREKGVSAYIGEGSNLWPAVHRSDAASAFRLAIERGAADGTYHAVAEEGVPFRLIAEAIGAGLGLPTVSIDAEEAPSHFGWFEDFAAIDQPASSERTAERLGWAPTGPDLLTDIAEAGYFSD